jgi:hypothetical protein
MSHRRGKKFEVTEDEGASPCSKVGGSACRLPEPANRREHGDCIAKTRSLESGELLILSGRELLADLMQPRRNRVAGGN